MTTPIATHELYKWYPPARVGAEAVKALSGVTLEVPRGAFYGLLGRNGEGKSTLMRCLLGLVHPTKGTASLLGGSFARMAPEERARVVYVPQRDQLAGSLTLREYCAYYRLIFPRWDQGYAETLTSRFNLPAERPIRALSGGVQRKVALLLALAARPDVLLLDEPAAGLDPVARRELLAELIDAMALADDLTVLFSTHILSDLEHLADHIGILHQGTLAVSAPVEVLRERFARMQIICTTEHEASQIRMPLTIQCERQGRVINAVVESPEETRRLLLLEAPEVSVELYPLSLEELLVEMMRHLSRPLEYREVA